MTTPTRCRQSQHFCDSTAALLWIDSTLATALPRSCRQHGAVVRVLSIDESAAVLSQGCCRLTAARQCCHEIGTPQLTMVIIRSANPYY